MTLTHIKVALALMLAVSMQGCKTSSSSSQGGVTNTVCRDTIVMQNNTHDSVYVGHDRLEKMIGDTLYVRDSITVYKLIRTRDSVFTHRIDSVPYKVEVIREVERKRNWFDWMCYGITGFIVLVIILYIVKRLSVF